MGADACSSVKTAILAGAKTRYTTPFPIYIKDKEVMEGGEVYIELSGAYRMPFQTIDGMVLYTERGCSVEIVAPSTEIKDDLYDDVEDILTAIDLAYIITNVSDLPIHAGQDRITFDVSMIL